MTTKPNRIIEAAKIVIGIITFFCAWELLASIIRWDFYPFIMVRNVPLLQYILVAGRVISFLSCILFIVYLFNAYGIKQSRLLPISFTMSAVYSLINLILIVIQIEITRAQHPDETSISINMMNLTLRYFWSGFIFILPIAVISILLAAKVIRRKTQKRPIVLPILLILLCFGNAVIYSGIIRYSFAFHAVSYYFLPELLINLSPFALFLLFCPLSYQKEPPVNNTYEAIKSKSAVAIRIALGALIIVTLFLTGIGIYNHINDVIRFSEITMFFTKQFLYFNAASLILIFVFLITKNKYRTKMKLNVLLSANVASMFAFAFLYLRYMTWHYTFDWFSTSVVILYLSATIIFLIIVLTKKWLKVLSWLCIAIAIATGYIFYLPTSTEEYQMPLLTMIYTFSFRFLTVAVYPIFLLIFAKMFKPVQITPKQEIIEQE